ncbi:MAG TPA: hypothetical protein VE503_04630 [Ornithinibacter sp.]|nr:hypothetical protein [Ornithinibacter sp.]
MRRLLSLTLALVAGFFVLSVPSAVAGGPTSVLLVNYDTGRSAAALNGSSAYTELQSILGDENRPAKSVTPPGVVEQSDSGVRLVWLIHDVNPWRIDNVHVVGSDVWVETYVDTSGTDPYAQSPIWHQPARAADLVTSLTALGVLGTGRSDAGGSAAAQGRVAPGASTDMVSQPSTSGVSWALATGLAAGGVLVGAVLGTVLARRGLRPLHIPRRAEAMG